MNDLVVTADIDGFGIVTDPADGYIWGVFNTVQHAWEAVKEARRMSVEMLQGKTT